MKYFSFTSKPISSIDQQSTFHRSNKTVETSWGTLVIDNGNTLEFLGVSFDINHLVIKFSGQTFDTDLLIVRCADNCPIVLHPYISDFSAMRAVCVLQLHLFFVKE